MKRFIILFVFSMVLFVSIASAEVVATVKSSSLIPEEITVKLTGYTVDVAQNRAVVVLQYGFDRKGKFIPIGDKEAVKFFKEDKKYKSFIKDLKVDMKKILNLALEEKEAVAAKEEKEKAENEKEKKGKK